MKVAIQRIDKTLPLPEYHTSGAVAFDLYARTDATIPAGALFKIPTNLIVETPPGFALVVSARSSLATKKGLILPNGIGVIDNDYCGPTDEILLSVYNITKTDVEVKKGERLAQAMFMAIDKAEWSEVDVMQAKNRGGFGSTGS